MSNEKDKGLDDIFKKKLEDPVNQAGYREEDWNYLEQMLEKHKKRKGIIYWLPVLAGAAALMLLFLGWWFFRPTSDHGNQTHFQAVTHRRANAGTNGGATRQETEHKQKTPEAVSYADNNVNRHGQKGKPFFPPLSVVGSRPGAGNDRVELSTPNRVTDEMILSQTPVRVFVSPQIMPQAINATYLPAKSAAAGSAADKHLSIKSGPHTGFRPQFAISVMEAPDLNGVGSFQQGKIGTNEGLLFSAGISRKFTISTGAIYSVKPYLTAFENYHTPYQFSVNPVNVTADCRMLDIPINIGYQIYNKQQNKISIGTGLSSYIMLHESYKFNYAEPYNAGPSNFTVQGVNKYFFGVLNLNATYLHQINSKVGVSLQPYMKLPLSNIGYSQVRLQTTGIAVGLSWNLNSSKP